VTKLIRFVLNGEALCLANVVLGLIGDNIAESRAPMLHQLAGDLAGIDVRYDLLIPLALNQPFDAVFATASAERHGLNITLPYKERVVAKLQVNDPLVRAMGAVNTVVFGSEGADGFNTDHSGFMAAYRGALGNAVPGPVCLLGAGGVGKAIAFALLGLGARDIRLVEVDRPKAMALAGALKAAEPSLAITVSDDPADCVPGAEGLLNCTPLGMDGYGGTPLGPEWMGTAAWAFDAVYTPRDTVFLQHAAAAGLQTVSGYELFFHQGVHAFWHFTGVDVDEFALRKALTDAE
jgi:shikimate dehydrogenase